MTAGVREPAWHQGGGGNNPSSVSEVDERLYRRGIGCRGRLGGKSASESEGIGTDSEAEGREDAQSGAALDSDGLERTIEDALKVADVDDLQDVGRLAHERDPEKYPYTHLTSLTTSNYVAGNPLYDILHDGRTTFDGPPLLSLTSLGSRVKPADGTAVTEWKVDMPALTDGGQSSYSSSPVTVFEGALPNLQNAKNMFSQSRLTSWNVELPSLTSADQMFSYVKLTEWHIDLPNLQVGHMMFTDAAFQTFSVAMPSLVRAGLMFFGDATLQSFSSEVPRLSNADRMFRYCSGLTQFSSALPSLTNGAGMFDSGKLNLDSVQTVARTIKDNSDMTTPPTLGIAIAKGLKGQVDVELDLIRAKGWAVNVYYR